MEIVLNVVKEKIRKKMLYITTVLGILVVMIFSSDMGSLTIGGKNIKDYYVLIPILINVVNFLSGAIALAMSITTIPNEYERRTSHLIWSRGISQSKYHIDLAIGNVIVSWISGIILSTQDNSNPTINIPRSSSRIFRRNAVKIMASPAN